MNINFDFPLILTLLVLITGLISLADFLFFAKKRKAVNKNQPKIIEYARSFFPVLLLVWIIRSFIVQPYRVPTGSLEPTVLPGDFIIVNQFAYGLRFPVFNKTLVEIGKPETGEVALFYWPVDPKVVFVKRVIGTPGDRIQYKDKTLFINGREMKQQILGVGENIEPGRAPVSVELRQEDLRGVKHDIFILPDGGLDQDLEFVVPEGHYFMMGDNRDFSDDSRTWGFVPESALIGKAFGILMSWDSNAKNVRWKRVGSAIR